MRTLNSWRHIDLMPSIRIHFSRHTDRDGLVRTIDVQFAFLCFCIEIGIKKIY